MVRMIFSTGILVTRESDMETDYGYEWDVGWDSLTKRDYVIIDIGDESIHLTKSDLQSMLSDMGEEE